MPRFFPAALLGGRLYPQGMGNWGPWDSRRLTYNPEDVVDRLLGVYEIVGDLKAMTHDELVAALRQSEGRAGAVTVWIVEGLEDCARWIWEQ